MARWVFEARSFQRKPEKPRCMLLAECAGETRVAASGPGESIGPDEVFEEPMSGRRQVMMMNAHFVRSTFLVYLMNCQRTTLNNNNVTLHLNVRG